MCGAGYLARPTHALHLQSLSTRFELRVTSYLCDSRWDVYDNHSVSLCSLIPSGRGTRETLWYEGSYKTQWNVQVVIASPTCASSRVPPPRTSAERAVTFVRRKGPLGSHFPTLGNLVFVGEERVATSYRRRRGVPANVINPYVESRLWYFLTPLHCIAETCWVILSAECQATQVFAKVGS